MPSGLHVKALWGGTWTGGLEEVRTVFPVAEQVRGAVSMYQGAVQKQGKAMMSKRSIVFDMVLSLGGNNSLLLFS